MSWFHGILDTMFGPPPAQAASVPPGSQRTQGLIRQFRNNDCGDLYTIEFCEGLENPWYTMYCHAHPDCVFPLGGPAHLLAGNAICVATGREPRTLDQAKAVALVWMYGFSNYRRTGMFPNGRFVTDIAEV